MHRNDPTAGVNQGAAEVVKELVEIKVTMDNIHPDGLSAKYYAAYEGVLSVAPKAQIILHELRAGATGEK